MASPRLRCESPGVCATARSCQLVSQPCFSPAPGHPVPWLRALTSSTSFVMMSFSCSEDQWVTLLPGPGPSLSPGLKYHFFWEPFTATIILLVKPNSTECLSHWVRTSQLLLLSVVNYGLCVCVSLFCLCDPAGQRCSYLLPNILSVPCT